MCSEGGPWGDCADATGERLHAATRISTAGTVGPAGATGPSALTTVWLGSECIPVSVGATRTTAIVPPATTRTRTAGLPLAITTRLPILGSSQPEAPRRGEQSRRPKPHRIVPRRCLDATRAVGKSI